jgi:hypothetical protein
MTTPTWRKDEFATATTRPRQREEIRQDLTFPYVAIGDAPGTACNKMKRGCGSA